MEMLLLTKNEVDTLISMSDTIEAVRKAFIAFNKGLVCQPPIVSVEIPEFKGEVDVKAGNYSEEEFICVKTATGFFDNPNLYGLPSGTALISLFDSKTGFPVCVMDGSLITNYRTGAAGGVSAACLARKDSSTVGVFGTGQQARMQVKAIKEVLPIRKAMVYGRNKAAALAYKKEMEAVLQLEVVVCEDAEQAVRDSDIVVTTTPGKEPAVKADWVRPGTHIIAIGADMEGKQELDPRIFVGTKIVVDSISQCILRGDTQHPLKAGLISKDDIHGEIDEILLGYKSGRCSEDEITIFDSTGMSIQDITTAAGRYRKAKKEVIGKSIKML